MLRIAVAAILLAAPLVAAPPQGGYDTKGFPQWGMETFRKPRDYVPIPRQPTEKYVILRYAEEQPEDRRKRKKITPEVMFVWIPWVEDPAPPEPEPEADPPAEEDRTKSKPRKGEEKKPPPPPINCLERFVEQRLQKWSLPDEPEVLKERDGYERVLYESASVEGKSRAVGWIWEWRNDQRTILMIGSCHEEDYKKQSKIWEYMAGKLRLSEPEEADMSKWVRFYERRPKFKGAEFRVKIREELASTEQWKAEDTENYIVIYNTKDEALIRTIKRELEAIRKVYEELFPPVKPVDAVSAVRVCKDKEEYHQYGGPSGSGGYWNWVAEELVFFDYEDVGKDHGSGKANSRIVLYHEAFHQYIFYSAGSMSPHIWYNEGHGDYFSGARFARTGEVSKIGVNPWRINTIQRAIREDEYVPWSDIIEYTQRQYYAKGYLNYAQGWSMVFFLRQSKEVQRREEWAKILPTYFDVLRDTFDAEMAQLAKAKRTEDREQIQAAEATAQQKASEAAFEGVDLEEIEEAWIAYTLGLKPPK